MIDASQDGFVRFHLTDSSEESASLIRGKKERCTGEKIENNNLKAIPLVPQLISEAYTRK